MNFGLRVKSLKFWIALGVGVFGVIGGYLKITGADITTWSALGEVLWSIINNPWLLALITGYVISALVDFTTPGIIDSEVTMQKINLQETAEAVVKREQMKKEHADAITALIEKREET